MEKMSYPKGLIRHSTQRAIATGKPETQVLRHIFRPRTLVYGSLLAAIVFAWLSGLYLRAPVKVDVIRDRNTLARIANNGNIENVYRFQLMNATEADGRYAISVAGLPGLKIATESNVDLKAAQSHTMAVRVQIEPGDLPAGSKPIVFTIRDLDRNVDIQEKSTFVVPR